MPKRFSPRFLFAFCCLLLVACHTEPANLAHGAPRFKDQPNKFGKIELTYADTTTADWADTRQKLDSFYKVQVAHGFNGSVLVGYKGKILYERYYGVANKSNAQPLTPNSASQLASTSKTFTAAAILYLHEHKYLNINDTVSQYLKSFPYKDVTIKMLLNHRSGIPDYLKWVPQYNKSDKMMYNPEVLELMYKHKPRIDFKADTRFKYCNTNFVVLASIVEEVTEMRFKDFMKKYIFLPLGMSNTFVYDPADGFPQGTTISYKANWAPYPMMFADGVYGDKGIYSTVEDMYRWDQSFYQKTILSNETMELSYGPCSFEKPGIKNYGLGWRMLCYPDGYKVIYHNGWWHGNNTCFYRFIKDNFTIIVLGNKYTSSIYRQPPVVFKIVNHTEDGAEDGLGGEE